MLPVLAHAGWQVETRRISRAAAERHIGGSHSKISRIESGRTGVKETDLDRLLDLYEVTDHKERQAIDERNRAVGLIRPAALRPRRCEQCNQHRARRR